MRSRAHQAALDQIRKLEALVGTQANEIVNLKRMINVDPAVFEFIEKIARSQSKFAAEARALIESDTLAKSEAQDADASETAPA